MPISAKRRQAEILSRCAEASYWMATRFSKDDRALRMREAAALIEEVATAMRAGERSAVSAVPPPRRPRAT